MFDEFLNKAAEVLATGEPFVRPRSCAFNLPSQASRRQSDHLCRRKIWGWIGGGCAQPVVIKEALKALVDGRPRLVRISPTAAPEEGIIDYTMACHSGGTLDIYIEPVLPKNQQAQDPVCGMSVSISAAKYQSDHNGSPVYFCCAGCKQAFDRQPEKYMVAQSG